MTQYVHNTHVDEELSKEYSGVTMQLPVVLVFIFPPLLKNQNQNKTTTTKNKQQNKQTTYFIKICYNFIQ